MDCNDGDNTVYPTAAELCSTNTVDNNCDGNVSDIDANASDKVLYGTDVDLDGYSIATGANFCPGTTNSGYVFPVSSPIDCDDAVASTNPGAAEACNGVDDNCVGVIDDGLTTYPFYTDTDNDGFCS